MTQAIRLRLKLTVPCRCSRYSCHKQVWHLADKLLRSIWLARNLQLLAKFGGWRGLAAPKDPPPSHQDSSRPPPQVHRHTYRWKNQTLGIGKPRAHVHGISTCMFHSQRAPSIHTRTRKNSESRRAKPDAESWAVLTLSEIKLWSNDSALHDSKAFAKIVQKAEPTHLFCSIPVSKGEETKTCHTCRANRSPPSFVFVCYADRQFMKEKLSKRQTNFQACRPPVHREQLHL